MNRIGLIGGVGYKATMFYYKIICEYVNNQLKEKNSPLMTIDSINPAEFFKTNHSTACSVLSETFYKLKNNGCKSIGLCCNTLHDYLDEEIIKDSAFQHIIISVSDIIKNRKYKNIGIIASSILIENNIYIPMLEKMTPCKVILPKEQASIDDMILNDLMNHSGNANTERQAGVINNSFKQDVDAILFGCTDLFLSQKYFDKDIINSANVHAKTLAKKYISSGDISEE